MSSVSFGTSTTNPNFYFDSDTNWVAFNTTTPAYLLTVEQRIGESGVVIGETPETTRLAVHGSIKASGAINANTGLDLAERYPIDPRCKTDNSCPQPGDLVSITEDMTIQKTSLPYDKNLIGVIPDNSAIVMGGRLNASTSLPVALIGRVPVKVSSEAGPIRIGDPLTSASSVPGAAMKATRPGRVIGIALESYNHLNEIGKIMVFVNSGWQGKDLSIEEDDSGNLVDISDAEELRKELANLGLAISGDEILTTEKIQAKLIETKKLSLNNPVLEKNGVTMADRATGELYCLYIKNNEMETRKGECKNIGK